MKNFVVVSYGYLVSCWLVYSLFLYLKVFVFYGIYVIDLIYNGLDSIEREYEKLGECFDLLICGRERFDIKIMVINKFYFLY